ncbi:MAG: hypothetical protein ACI3X7_08865 [Bacteroidaceae bacterium]
MKRTKLVTGIVLTALLSTSCVNEDYDLDDIDMNIGINTDLELPLINSGEVTLANFIGDNDFLKTTTLPDGEVFYATASGSFRSEFPAIANGTLTFNTSATDITISDLPDFLKSDDVRLDLENPVIIANIERDRRIGNGTITGNIELSTEGISKCTIDGLKAKAGMSSQYVATAEDRNLPQELLNPDYGTPEWLEPETGSVNGIFNERIPNTVSIVVKGLSAEGVTPAYDLNNPYYINVDMTLYAPLCIGSSNFQLAYDATETGWQDDFDEDIRKMDVDEITLSATLENNLPLKTIVEIKPIDKNGDDVIGLSVLSVEAKENGSTQFTYSLKSNIKGLTLNDFINGTNGARALDGVAIKTMLKASDQSVGKYITTKASARLKDVRTKIKGQFVYDAN